MGAQHTLLPAMRAPHEVVRGVGLLKASRGFKASELNKNDKQNVIDRGTFLDD